MREPWQNSVSALNTCPQDGNRSARRAFLNGKANGYPWHNTIAEASGNIMKDENKTANFMDEMLKEQSMPFQTYLAKNYIGKPPAKVTRDAIRGGI